MLSLNFWELLHHGVLNLRGTGSLKFLLPGVGQGFFQAIQIYSCRYLNSWDFFFTGEGERGSFITSVLDSFFAVAGMQMVVDRSWNGSLPVMEWFFTGPGMVPD